MPALSSWIVPSSIAAVAQQSRTPARNAVLLILILPAGPRSNITGLNNEVPLPPEGGPILSPGS